MISVIMSTYNESLSDIRLSVESILGQTYKTLEFIIVLDNPNNHEIRAYLTQVEQNDERVRLLQNDKNIGLANSLNKAIMESKGEYIARMDADDIAFPMRLEKQIQYMKENPRCSVLATDRIDIDENGTPLRTSHILIDDQKTIKEALTYCNVLTHPTVLMKREVLERVGGYRDFKAAQDYDLWLRLRKYKVEFHILPEVLLYYRIRNSGITKSNVAKQYSYVLYAQYLDKVECNGEDLFSSEGYERFTERKKLLKQEDKARFNEAYRLFYHGADTFHGGRKVRGLLTIAKSIMKHRAIVGQFYSSQKCNRIIGNYVHVK